ncbi:MAG: T9SS type A sorting domain-containing protein [Bacteroidia bacterium]
MKALFTLSLFVILLSGIVFGQTGDLYLFGEGAHLQYVRFPARTVHNLDSLPATNLAAANGKLYASFSQHQGTGKYLRGIARYDLVTHQREDSTTAIKALDVDVWENMLVVTAAEAPFIRVVDPANQYQSRFELLDTSFVGGAIKTLVHDDRAYVLGSDKVAVIDLDLEDTIAVVRTDTIPDFWTTCYNWDLEEAGDQIYIYAEYATGAIRTTLLRIDPATLIASQVAHVEFDLSLEMTEAGDKMYTYGWQGYYDLVADSLHRDPAASDPYRYVVAWDGSSQTAFMKNGRTQTDSTIPMTIKNGQAGQPITARPFANGFYVPLSQVNSNDGGLSFQYSVFPNPTPDLLEISFPAPTQVFRYRMLDPQGRTLMAGVPQGSRGFQVDLRKLPRGGYFLEIQSAEGTVLEPVMKW